LDGRLSGIERRKTRGAARALMPSVRSYCTAFCARTVEVHKARLMQKLGVGSIPDLVRLSLRAG
jgi:FixJ family two-component response regulator